MHLLLIGGGGREHALAWKLAQSPRVTHISVAPGNGGTATAEKTKNVAIGADDVPALLDFAQQQAVDLTVVGPEAPLAAGIADQFQAAGLPIFGPTQIAAQLETSKAFSKRFMEEHAIPTGRAIIVTDFDEAARYMRQLDDVPVIKASGLAGGKGVLLPETMGGAAVVVQQMLLEDRFGAAGKTVLIEERLTGPEVSVLAFADGERFALMPTAQDHKRLMKKDRGPNTGGMGAFAPSPRATPELLDQIARQVIGPTLAGMKAAGASFMGVLYAGMMLTPQGPKVLEFNCRFGDPEAQTILPLLESDLLEVLIACVEGRLNEVVPVWRNGAAATVVMAARGYPGEYEVGQTITGIDAAQAAGALVFQAGTKQVEDRLVSAGGRVLNITATGDAMEAALRTAYRGVRAIHFNGAHYRTDIGKK
ncbi:MAG: phosphoribosylamine--glycine ligase [Caldilineaceae bacterium]|nr:phosphoribosylamine--glycine ligase [Caldilineaceae bacterium]